MNMHRHLLLSVLFPLLAIVALPARAETVCIKHGACPFDLSSFDCADTPRSSFIRRVCYDADERFMAIDLNETWYLYCAVDPATVHGLLTAHRRAGFTMLTFVETRRAGAERSTAPNDNSHAVIRRQGLDPPPGLSIALSPARRRCAARRTGLAENLRRNIITRAKQRL